MPHPSLSHSRARSANWLLIVLLMLSPFGRHAAAAVLCFGSDGHVGMELSGIPNGVEIPLHPTEEDHAHDECETADPVHSDPCMDLPLPTGGDSDCVAYTKSDSTIDGAFLSFVTREPVRYDVPDVGDAIPTAPSIRLRFPSTALHLDSTVLLI